MTEGLAEEAKADRGYRGVAPISLLVGNIQSDQGEVYVRYIQNPSSHKHVRLSGARLKDIEWNKWGNVKFGKKKKGPKK